MSNTELILALLQGGEITRARAMECLEAEAKGTFKPDWLPVRTLPFGLDELPDDRLQSIAQDLYRLNKLVRALVTKSCNLYTYKLFTPEYAQALTQLQGAELEYQLFLEKIRAKTSTKAQGFAVQSDNHGK